MNSGGKVCFTGILSGWIVKDFYPIDDIPGGVYLTAFHSDNVNAVQIRAMFDFIQHHRIALPSPTVFRLNEIAKAHKLMEQNPAQGKIVIVNAQ